MRQFEAADLPRSRPGERAFLMAEQFIFQQASRNGSAIHFDKGVLAARTELMKRARDEFFPCSCFPSDQDGGAGRRNLLHLFKDTFERLAVPYQLIEVVGSLDFFF